MKENIIRRKKDQLRISISNNVQFHLSAGFEDIHFIHHAIPEFNYDEVDISTELFGHKMNAPIVIEGMVGGIEEANKINLSLAEAAEALGIAMGVGSQRIAIENPELADNFRMVRRKAPTSFLIANIGALETIKDPRIARKAVEMIDADALAIHLNVLQEVVQVEGKKNFKGILNGIRGVVEVVNIPVIVKETGSGISSEVTAKLAEIGVKAIDVGGAGGTSWSAIEYYRARKLGDKLKESLGREFWDWGIPTPVSIVESRSVASNIVLIASGGVRSGIDIAKSIALGADLVGIAYPLLKPAMKGPDSVIKVLSYLIEQLRSTMVLTNCKSITDLKKAPVVITGRVAEWLRARLGDKVIERYAHRR